MTDNDKGTQLFVAKKMLTRKEFKIQRALGLITWDNISALHLNQIQTLPFDIEELKKYSASARKELGICFTGPGGIDVHQYSSETMEEYNKRVLDWMEDQLDD